MITTKVPIISTIGEKKSVSVKAKVAYVNIEKNGAWTLNDIKNISPNTTLLSNLLILSVFTSLIFLTFSISALMSRYIGDI